MNDQVTVGCMAAIRAAAGLIEVIGAIIILRLGTVPKALQVNAFLAAAGPIFMLAVTGVGLLGLAGRIPPVKVVLIAVGAGLILAGSR
ncbi:MAG: DUF2619 domain-containing protein [Bacillota bacterium]|jgi:hypothetical protein|nr:DUF2619 domain-containing protein [Bacillota bacterium]NLH87751.1 DUF2619 domain-containing protein [Bacillota bacterium]HAN87584.1 DUF2619 domain-containing protein [Bacillota bacterium]